jgi:hypothetical protein
MLAADLLSPDGLARIQTLVGDRPTLLLPVVADELTGFNAIPDAMAQVLASKVGHTRAPAFQRLVTLATFEGHVQPGAN